MKLCECGCGKPTEIARKTVTKYGHVKGQPKNRIGGHVPHNVSPEHRKRLREHMLRIREKSSAVRGGAEHYTWKGAGASYTTIHQWVRRHWKKTGTCEDCGQTAKPTDWANLSGNYLRDDRSDWKELCRSCHWKLDGKIVNITGVSPHGRANSR